MAPVPEHLRRDYDPSNPYHVNADMALLGLAAYPEDLQQACFASGCDSWESFVMALEFAAMLGFVEELAYARRYAITAAGRRHGVDVLQEEQRERAAGRLTRREASTAHADLLYQHMVTPEHPLARKLWEMMQGREAEPLTAPERELLAAHVELQSGPLRQELIDKLKTTSADA